MAGIIFLDILKRKKKQRISYDTACNGVGFKSQEKTGNAKRQRNTKTCRICLKVDKNIAYVPIFDEIASQATAENIRKFGGVEINEDDGLPKFLCRNCHDLLQGAVQFRQQAQASDRRLRAPINASNNNDTTDSDSGNEQNGQNDEFNCNNCLSIFITTDELSEHRSSDCQRRVPCPDCLQPLLRDELPAHRARAHAAPVKAAPAAATAKPYVCDSCGKCFAYKAHFQRHMIIHTDQLPHKCELCPYRGRFQESVQRHMRVHTGEKPYACDQCPSRFIDCSNLKKHKRTHTGHEFKCEMCERGFYTQRKLQEHLRVDHTGIKEHKCDICDKEFAHRKHLMQHTRTVHKRAKLICGRLPLYLQVENKRREQEQSQEVAEETAGNQLC